MRLIEVTMSLMSERRVRSAAAMLLAIVSLALPMRTRPAMTLAASELSRLRAELEKGGRGLYPPIEPYRRRYVAVGDGHELYVEEAGNPGGLPVVFLHGGPGAGFGPSSRRFFDPLRYRIVLFDQRASGKSKYVDPMRGNGAPELTEDVEKVRAALGIDRWIVFGGSWGSTLALLYAQRHPDRVDALVLRGIYFGTKAELSWLDPAQRKEPYAIHWRAFLEGLSEAERRDPLAAYDRRLASPDENVRVAAARKWRSYEDALLGAKPPDHVLTSKETRFDEDVKGNVLNAEVEVRLIQRNCFITPALGILAHLDTIRRIPTFIVQGADDLDCPARGSARALRRAFPEAFYWATKGTGHSAYESRNAAALVAIMDFLGTIAR